MISPSAAPLTRPYSASELPYSARAQGLMKKGAETLWPSIVVLCEQLVSYIPAFGLDLTYARVLFS